MLYKKNLSEKLNTELFKNPSSEYRGAPFWAWNCKLDKGELLWQLEVLKKMGFGGAHMHVRTGMSTPYLGDEYMALIKACVDKAKKENMLAWLYDEDRWPSGAAGGLVTKEHKYRKRHLLFTAEPYSSTKNLARSVNEMAAVGARTENGRLLACYDVKLSSDGKLISYKTISESEEASGDKWYAYLEVAGDSGWFNNQAYINTLDKEAMDRFIEVTYKAYEKTVGDEFSKTVNAIFTDEPQFSIKETLNYATAKKDVTVPWTDDLTDTYKEAYGDDLLINLPELFWDKSDGTPSKIRYHYHDHVCERFTKAFADNCGAWCREHGIALTGHMMAEDTLGSQTHAIGEAMRGYRGFGIPGIDVLCAKFEYAAAKQAQSAVHQFGREAMTSELYGVTNWDFDFRGHKLHGDWQAALGVSVRVPHLAWVSMEGEAKRDYPAPIGYQSPWWKKYSYIEDHFARINTAMTRGKPIVKVGVIHPVESYWYHWGPNDTSALARKELDENFSSLINWLLFGSVDFDFISESLFPSLCTEAASPLKVGEMSYDAVLIPACESLRSTTLDRLEAFVKGGGKLIFAGALPYIEDGVLSDRAKLLAKQCECVPFSNGAILSALEEYRTVEIRTADGALTNDLIYQLRQDNTSDWLFIAHAKEPYNKDITHPKCLKIRIKGMYKPTLYNTLTGQTEPLIYTAANGYTVIHRMVCEYDSLLINLERIKGDSVGVDEVPRISHGAVKKLLPLTVDYELDEDNALLLDQAEYALDGEELHPIEEVLRIDDICRRRLGFVSRRSGNSAQPWVIPEKEIVNFVRLSFKIISEIEYEGAHLAIENAENTKISFNGQHVPSDVIGWYTDKSIKRVALPKIKAGVNVLEATVPLGERTGLEWAYILGDFGVEVHGRSAVITKKRERLGFGDICHQGLPFYGGNVTYKIPVNSNGGEFVISSSRYRGSLQCVSVDGGAEIPMVLPPYTVSLGNLSKGEHIIDLTLYGHRRNGFGPVHLADLKETWIGPNAWVSDGQSWCYDYVMTEEGILKTPVVSEK